MTKIIKYTMKHGINFGTMRELMIKQAKKGI